MDDVGKHVDDLGKVVHDVVGSIPLVGSRENGFLRGLLSNKSNYQFDYVIVLI